MANTSNIVHFGCKLQKRKYSFKLLREEYALENTKSSLSYRSPELEKKGAYAHAEGTEYAEAWCREYRKLCLKNFDLQMKYFESLDSAAFEQAVQKLQQRFPSLEEVTDLSLYKGVPGMYVMVLGGYRQIYIGQADDICKRIRGHWTNTVPFDRVLFPMFDAEGSVMSIDAFRALDTTRILAWKTRPEGMLEAEMIEAVPPMFICNRIGGGITDGFAAMATMNRR